jgi:hypothetical protein
MLSVYSSYLIAGFGYDYSIKITKVNSKYPGPPVDSNFFITKFLIFCSKVAHNQEGFIFLQYDV